MDAVFRIADCITVMVNGTVIACGTPDYVRNRTQNDRLSCRSSSHACQSWAGVWRDPQERQVVLQRTR